MDLLSLASVFSLRNSAFNRSVLNSAEADRRNGNGSEGEDGIGSSCFIIAEGSHCSVAIVPSPFGSSAVEGSFGSVGSVRIEGSLVSDEAFGSFGFVD